MDTYKFANCDGDEFNVEFSFIDEARAFACIADLWFMGKVESESKNEAINKGLAWCIKESYPIKEIKADDVLSTIGIIKL